MAADRSARGNEKKTEPPPEAREQAQGFGNLRAHVPAEIRNVSFPVSVRGYERRSVDAYIHRVNRVIAELEVSRSPQAAVRHAVERVTEQTKGILQQARKSAEQITAAAHEEAEGIMAGAKAEAAELVVNASADADRARAEADEVVAAARAEADDILGRANAGAEKTVASAKAEAEKTLADAKAEAEKMLDQARGEAAEQRRRSDEEIASVHQDAETRLRGLQADTEAVWKERSELLGEIHAMASRLQQAASAAAARFSAEEVAEPEEPTRVLPPETETEPAAVAATEEPTQPDSAAPVSPRRRGRASRTPG